MALIWSDEEVMPDDVSRADRGPGPVGTRDLGGRRSVLSAADGADNTRLGAGASAPFVFDYDWDYLMDKLDELINE